jgi:hypothetical protein
MCDPVTYYPEIDIPYLEKFVQDQMIQRFDVEIMSKSVYRIYNAKIKSINLLPDAFRQDANIQKFLGVILNG